VPLGFLLTSVIRDFSFSVSRSDLVNSSSLATSWAIWDVKRGWGDLLNRWWRICS